ncbi:DNA-binding transcriptional regulator, MarR family [Actinacidiphila alni]|uniref:DNA-binding transcriptional regulator, MarR family n=1 Tax=Actinacidiphila alni TaxID=380248 RepID=A0A1I2KXT1_9ACTN|nr:MarR family transcriptional regulator [Actinacidiphila alni]SFF71158.1 DNA-binding transcriptional regulator, MarR family [Actinacidiphila alni]
MDATSAALDVIEHQAAVLVRNFELLYRRTDIHDDLDRAEYLLLRTLAESGPQDINSLAAALGLDPSTAGRQVAALQGLGLVARSPAPTDRRRSIITPTGEGLRRMEEVRVRRAESLAGLLEGWSEEERHTLGVMFTKYNRSVAERFLTAAPAPEPAGAR